MPYGSHGVCTSPSNAFAVDCGSATFSIAFVVTLIFIFIFKSVFNLGPFVFIVLENYFRFNVLIFHCCCGTINRPFCSLFH